MSKYAIENEPTYCLSYMENVPKRRKEKEHTAIITVSYIPSTTTLN